MKSDCMVFRANMVSGWNVWSNGTRCSSSMDDGEISRPLKRKRTDLGRCRSGKVATRKAYSFNVFSEVEKEWTSDHTRRRSSVTAEWRR